MPELKKTALRIFHETLAAIDIVATMQRKLQREGSLLRWDEVCVDLATFEKIFVVAAGKAAHAIPTIRVADMTIPCTAANILAARPSAVLQYMNPSSAIRNSDSE